MSIEVCVCRECGERFYDLDEVDNHPCPMAKDDPRDATIAELRAEVDTLAKSWRAAEDENDELRAEVERLRRNFDGMQQKWLQEQVEHEGTKASLVELSNKLDNAEARAWRAALLAKVKP